VKRRVQAGFINSSETMLPVQSVLLTYVVDDWISPVGIPQLVSAPLLQPLIFLVEVNVVQVLSLKVYWYAFVPLHTKDSNEPITPRLALHNPVASAFVSIILPVQLAFSIELTRTQLVCCCCDWIIERKTTSTTTISFCCIFFIFFYFFIVV